MESGRFKKGWKKFSQNRLALVGLVYIALFFSSALLVPWLAPYHYETTSPSEALLTGSASHILGTDELGRDLFSRILYGARNALLVSVGSVLVGLILGALAGAFSGYFGGWFDLVMVRIIDIMYSFPQFLLMIILIAVLGRGLPTVFLAIGITSWAGYARLVRGQVMGVKNLDYVEAARSLGAGNGRIIIKYILPNIAGPLIVAISFGIPFAMMAESAMSLIGMGLRPPMPSWGNLINSGMMQMYGFPHLVIWPALTFGLTLLGFTFVGDGLREVYGKE